MLRLHICNLSDCKFMKVMLTHNTVEELEACDIGIGYIASALQDKKHEVQLWLRNLSDKEFCQKLAKYNPDVIGIKILFSGIPVVLRWIELIRKTTRSLIVIAGPHITCDPKNVLTQIPADYAFQGDGERVFPQFVAHIEQGNLEENLDSIKGLVYRKNGICFSNPVDNIKKLDELSFPAWNLMPPAQYDSLFCKNPPAASIMISRGCTHKCSFCTEGLRSVSYRSVENVVAEIKYLVENFSVREIQFVDSNFLFTKKYIMALCNAILLSGIRISFSAPNGMRLEWLDEELCEFLAKIGFYRANLGVESGSEEILNMIEKRALPESFYKKVPILRKNGIYTVGNFMLGFPNETKKQMKETLKLALSLDLTGANFSIYVPLPGTRLFEEMVANGKIESQPNYHNYNYVTYENNLTEISAAQLRRFRNWCIIRFIFRWKTIKILFEFLRDKKMRQNLIHRLYGMYVQKYVKQIKRTKQTKQIKQTN